MTPKALTVGERIKAIRGDKVSQAEFGELLGSSQGAVSAWERDDKDRSPSAAIYFRLAALARDPEDSIFFLQQAGLQPDGVMKVANILLRKGDVNMDAILATAEEKLKERTGDQKQMVDEGKVVLVPPFPEGASAAERPVLAAPSLLVPNKASIYYVVAPNDPFDTASHGCAPGDFVFFDASVSGDGGTLEQLVGDEIVLRLRFSHGAPNQWGELFIGRVGWVHALHGGNRRAEHLALYRSDAHPHTHGDLGLVKLGGSWRKKHGDKPLSHPGIPFENLRDWYEDSECQVLGKFIARFNAGTVGIWKQEAQKESQDNRIKRNLGLL